MDNNFDIHKSVSVSRDVVFCGLRAFTQHRARHRTATLEVLIHGTGLSRPISSDVWTLI